MAEELKGPAHELFQHLKAHVEVMRRDQIMSDCQLSTAFLGVGVVLVKETIGPAYAVEWLRDLANHIEETEGGNPQ